jgi:hypothetical protein
VPPTNVHSSLATKSAEQWVAMISVVLFQPNTDSLLQHCAKSGRVIIHIEQLLASSRKFAGCFIPFTVVVAFFHYPEALRKLIALSIRLLTVSVVFMNSNF